MANPKFYELQRLRKSTWDTPRFIRGYDVTLDDRPGPAPRTTAHGQPGSSSGPGPGWPSPTSGTPARRSTSRSPPNSPPEQSARSARCSPTTTASWSPRRDRARPSWPAPIIAERGTSTLVLVDRKALAEQWRTRDRSSSSASRPGQVGGGRRKLTGVVDIAMLPTLARHDDIAELTTATGRSSSTSATTSLPPRTTTRSNGSAPSSGSASPPHPTRRDGLGELVTWQLGPVRHTMTDESLAPSWTAGITARDPDGVLHVHETDFRSDDSTCTRPAPRRGPPRPHRRRTRNAQIVDDVAAALAPRTELPCPHPTGRPRRRPRVAARRSAATKR